MRVLITGATGFVGRKLTRRLRRDGHAVVALSRDRERAQRILGQDVEVLTSSALTAAVQGVDAVVNLAGEPVIGRWTRARRDAIRRSRVDATTALVAAMAKAQPRPRVLVSASAIGIYGDGGQRELTDGEAASPGEDFLAQVCVDWEAGAMRAEALGVRVVIPRIGVVLGRGGGAWEPMRVAGRLGVSPLPGAPEGWFSWIHLDDLVELLAHAVTDPAFHGAYNAVAPQPVTRRDLERLLTGCLGVPHRLPTPALAVKLALGEASVVLTASQKVVPHRLSSAGFPFRHGELSGALAELTGRSAAGPHDAPPSSPV